jgi:hypothetical protein
MNNRLNIGDIVVCNKDYVETEFGRRSYSVYSYNHNGRDSICLLKQGKKYKIKNILRDVNDIIIQIEIENELGQPYWCDVRRFNTIKELRRIKLKRINKNVHRS